MNMQCHRVLARLLGQQDAAFLPIRTPGHWLRGEAQRQRQAVLSGAGLPWQPGSPEASIRERDLEALAELGRAGLVRVHRELSEPTRVVLTGDGDELARSLVGLPGLADAADVFADLEAMRSMGLVASHLGREWTPEWAAAGLKPDWQCADEPESREKLARLECRAAPLLTRGLAEANCDIRGRAWYALADGAERPGPTDRDLPEASEELRGEFGRSFDAARTKIHAAQHGPKIGPPPRPMPGGLKLAAWQSAG